MRKILNVTGLIVLALIFTQLAFADTVRRYPGAAVRRDNENVSRHEINSAQRAANNTGARLGVARRNGAGENGARLPEGGARRPW